MNILANTTLAEQGQLIPFQEDQNRALSVAKTNFVYGFGKYQWISFFEFLTEKEALLFSCGILGRNVRIALIAQCALQEPIRKLKI